MYHDPAPNDPIALDRYLASREASDEDIISRLYQDDVITTSTAPWFCSCLIFQEPVCKGDTVRLVDDQLCCSDRCALASWREHSGA